jgi:hypothetical protein
MTRYVLPVMVSMAERIAGLEPWFRHGMSTPYQK